MAVEPKQTLLDKPQAVPGVPPDAPGAVAGGGGLISALKSLVPAIGGAVTPGAGAGAPAVDQDAAPAAPEEPEAAPVGPDAAPEPPAEEQAEEQAPEAQGVQPDPKADGSRLVKYGGMVFRVGAGDGPEDIRRKVIDYLKTPAGHANIDTNGEAPFFVRAMVGGAHTPEDKLATLRKHYPDAQPFEVENGEQNFIFTSRETGKPTLFDKPGFTPGDVAPYTRPVFVAAGAALGGAAALPVGGPIGSALAGGYAGATTGVAYDLLARLFGGVQDTRSGLKRAAGTVEELLALASGERAGQLVGKYVIPPVARKGKEIVQRALVGGAAAQQRATELLKQFKELGIPPTGGMLSPRVAGIEEAVSKTSSKADEVLRKNAEETIKYVGEAARSAAAKIGAPRTQQKIGKVIKDAGEGARDRFLAKQKVLEEKLTEAIGNDAIIKIPSVKALRFQFAKKIKKPRMVQEPFIDADLLIKRRPPTIDPTDTTQSMPKSLAPVYRGMLTEMKRLESDAARWGGVPYWGIRDFRSYVGQRLAAAKIGSKKEAHYKMIYKALSDDIEAHVDKIGGAVTKQWRETNAFTRDWHTGAEAFLKKYKKLNPEDAWDKLISSGRKGGTTLGKLRNEFTKEEWKDISATVVQKMGYKKWGNEGDNVFSAKTYAANYRSIADEAKEELFDNAAPGLREAMDKLMAGMDEIANSAALEGLANPARTMFSLNAGGVLGLMSDSAFAVARNTVGRLLPGKQIAKLMTNPKFVEWLATPIAKKASKRQISEHVGRLYAVAEAAPEIREEVQAYLAALAGEDGGQDEGQDDATTAPMAMP